MPDSSSIFQRTPASTSAGRRLHAGHFAFLRAVVQGIDPREAWRRYLALESDPADTRRLRSAIAWMRDEFAAAAQREDRHGTARLLRLDLRTLLADTGPAPPSLEDFAAAQGIEDFSHDEQLAAYEDAHGRASARQRRRGRLIDRQLQALRWLEGLVVRPPRAADGLGSWLNAALARRLQAAGVRTLADLVQRIDARGSRWHAGIPGVGAGKAARVMAWLAQHLPETGLALAPHAALPPGRQPAQPAGPGIRPLGRLQLPPALQGAPAPGCRLAAANDLQAIDAWLAGRSAHTARAYRREAERLLLWATVQRGLPLGALSAADCAAYLAFLADPQPRAAWCGPRHHGRATALWRPFEGPLAPAARRHAATVLAGLGRWLAAQGYLAANPWQGLAAPARARAPLDPARSLDAADWHLVITQAASRPDTPAQRRLVLALHLLHDTGLRRAEALAARLADVAPAAEGQGAVLRVPGRGPRARTVPLSPATLHALARHLQQRGLAADPAHPASRDAHLLGQAPAASPRAQGLRRPPPDPQAGIDAATLHAQLKRFFASVARGLAAGGDAAGAARLLQASAHWLRHTHGRAALQGGVPLPAVQRTLGHASPRTTAAYRRVSAPAPSP